MYTIFGNQLSDAMNISKLSLDYSAIIFFAIFVPFGIPSALLLRRENGLQLSVLLLGVLTLVGAAIKCIKLDWNYIMVGQTIQVKQKKKYNKNIIYYK